MPRGDRDDGARVADDGACPSARGDCGGGNEYDVRFDRDLATTVLAMEAGGARTAIRPRRRVRAATDAIVGDSSRALRFDSIRMIVAALSFLLFWVVE